MNGAKLSILLWVFVFLAMSLTAARLVAYDDAVQVCMTATSLIERGSFAIEPIRVDVLQGPDGSHYSKYPLMYVLQCVPGLLLRAAADGIAHEPAISNWAFALVPHAISATMVLGVFQLARALGAGVPGGVALALAALFTTPLWVSGRTLYSESLQTLLVVYSILAAVRARDGHRRWAFAWLGFLSGVALNTKATLLVLPLAIVVDQLHERWTRERVFNLCCITLPSALVGVGAWLAYNHVRFGNVLQHGYAADRDGLIGFGVPLASGLYGLLLSAGKSVFIYAPILLFSVAMVPRWWRERRRDLVLLFIPSILTIALNAKWWAWSGDWAWGPRLILPIVPLLALPAIDVFERSSKLPRLVFGLLVAAGVYVQVLGVSVDPYQYFRVTKPIARVTLGRTPGEPTPMLRDSLVAAHFVPELNPIVVQQWLLMRFLSGAEWDAQSDYPWKSLGISSWRPSEDPTPKNLNFWLSSSSSNAAWWLSLIVFALTLVTGLYLWGAVHGRSMESRTRTQSRPRRP